MNAFSSPPWVGAPCASPARPSGPRHTSFDGRATLKIAESRFGMLNWFFMTRSTRNWRILVGGSEEVGVIEPIWFENGVVAGTQA